MDTEQLVGNDEVEFTRKNDDGRSYDRTRRNRRVPARLPILCIAKNRYSCGSKPIKKKRVEPLLI